MADGIQIDVEGLSAIQKMLDDLSKEAGDRAIHKALKAGAVVTQVAVTEEAPVKDSTGGMLPDGALKSDIEIHFKRDKQGTLSAIVGPGKYTSHVARWVEYGHRLVRGGRSALNKKTGKTSGPGTQVGDVEEHPFIRPAYERSRQEALEAIVTTLKTEVDNETRKAADKRL